MTQRSVGVIRQQVLLRHVGDVFGFGVLSEEMVERLVLRWPNRLRNREPPLLGVVEHRIYIENDSAEREDAMPHHLSDRVFGETWFHRRDIGNRPPACKMRDLKGHRCAPVPGL